MKYRDNVEANKEKDIAIKHIEIEADDRQAITVGDIRHLVTQMVDFPDNIPLAVRDDSSISMWHRIRALRVSRAIKIANLKGLMENGHE